MATSELDVHGMTQTEAVEALVGACNAALSRGGRSAVVRVVHGYGSSGAGGVLRARLRRFCDAHADRTRYVRGEDTDNNPGLTVVTVVGPLPDARQRLGDAIVRYCAGRPRPKERIARRFRKAGDRAVAAALLDLVRTGRLRKIAGPDGGYRAMNER